MGDMKTPDFDDLLAAFDIPDMVDPKAAIESGHHDDNDGQLRQSSATVNTSADETNNSSTGHDVGVSVIVKNVRNMDSNEHGGASLEKDRRGQFQCHPQPIGIGNGLHNGLLPKIRAGSHYTKNGWKVPREEGQQITKQSSPFNQFSPISSAEEFDDDEKIEVVDPMDKQGGGSISKSTTPREHQNSKSSASVNVSRLRANGKKKKDHNKNVNGTLVDSKSTSPTKSPLPKEELKETVLKTDEQCKEAGETSGVVSNQTKTKSSAKLSSCIAAIAALSAKKASTTDLSVLDSPTTQKETTQANENPRAQEKPHEQESALEFAKRLLDKTKQPDSPSSVTSEGSSKGSLASSTDATPFIPKVRIKTIKTSSGQIKRTVTRVLPELDPEALRKGESTQAIITPTSTIFSSPTRHPLPTTVVATAGGPSIEITKQMTIKPVATAFLPVSAVKTAGSQVINLKLANNTTVKATVIPAASVQSASSAILKAANAIQQQTVMVPASSLANAKLVPKTVHLSNLNLLPQTISSAVCDLQQAFSTSKQPQNQQSQVKQKTVLPGRSSKTVSRVQVFTSSQSSVVDAFNKVLSSINPVPVYVPNLSPPSSACISLPSRGYKCLECGDSFALEKSLTQHYERRSVRIEVTCNHCAKSLVFYNKCSLLSHARGHKDKGVVMQCSHLILKPIPADQMIPTAPSPPNPISATSASQVLAPTNQISGKVAVAVGSQTAVISAPCSAPLVAAMPLDDDASKLSRHSLKCMECNEMFKDDSSLAMHYQQAPESNEQVCVIC